MKAFLFVLTLLCCSSAAAQSYGLTDRDLRIVRVLSDLAVERSSAIKGAALLSNYFISLFYLIILYLFLFNLFYIYFYLTYFTFIFI